jgi:glycosyltransferase involved in cell wall biosynthesis
MEIIETEKVHFVTISTKKNLRFAHVLGTSLLSNNPGATFRIFVVDSRPEDLKGWSGVSYLFPEDLGLERFEYLKMALALDEQEFVSTLRPWVIEKSLQDGARAAIFFDTTIYVLDNLAGLIRSVLESPITLTPIILQPKGLEPSPPNESEILMAGTFQHGFIGVRSGESEFLSWWKGRFNATRDLKSNHEPIRNQRWIDLTPTLWEVKIITDSAFNVGYWNLDQRKLTLEKDKTLVDGNPIRFFNFSSFNPDTPWILSGDLGNNSGVWPNHDPALSLLCDSYARQVRDQKLEIQNDSYAFGILDGERNITTPIRESYRKLIFSALEDSTLTVPTPFIGDDQAVLRSLSQKLPNSDYVNHQMLGVWKSRGDLQDAFPDPLGFDGLRFQNWAWSSGVEEGEFEPEDLTPPKNTDSKGIDISSLEVSEVCGVNVVGYLSSELGMGELARSVRSVVEFSGLPFTSITNNRNLSRKAIESANENPTELFPINLVVLNADQMTNWSTLDEYSAISGLATIGIWAWELEDFPEGFEAVINELEEIWTISEFARASIQKRTTKPVFVFPIPLSIAEEKPSEPFGVNINEKIGKDYFLVMFDYQSSMGRKNPLAAIEAFKLAFDGQGDVQLVIKTLNADLWPTERERLLYEARKVNNVKVIDEYLTRLEVRQLISGALAYISLHRSEGYGLTCAEAMAEGTPVIATNYSGNLDFMTPENSLLVDYSLVKVVDPNGAYTIDSNWAEPSVESATKFMQAVYTDRDFAHRVGKRGKDSIFNQATTETASAFVLNRIEDVYNRIISPKVEKLENSTQAIAEDKAKELRFSKTFFSFPRKKN